MNSTTVLLYLISVSSLYNEPQFCGIVYMAPAKRCSNAIGPVAYFVIGKLKGDTLPCIYSSLPNSFSSFALLSLPSKPTLRLRHRSVASTAIPKVLEHHR